MRSSYLLLKVFRRRIGICLFIEFVLIFLMAADDIRLNRPERALDAFGFAFVIAFVLSLFIQFKTRLSTWPFPVSTRQRAWLPMLAFGLIWAMGCLAILLVILYRGIGPSSTVELILSMIARLPLYVVGFLFVSRIWRARPHFLGFAGFMYFGANEVNAAGYQALASTYALWWPAVLGAIAFYIYEAPIQLGRQDRLCAGPSNNPIAFRMGDLAVTCRRDLVTWIADTVEGAMFLCLIIASLFRFLPLWIPNSFDDLLSPLSMITLVPLMLAVWLIAVFRSQYKCVLASGLNPASAFWLSLMQMSIVLAPLAQTLGAKKGVVARCAQCGTEKFLWALHCPHCAHAGAGTIANKRLARFAQGKSPLPRGRMRLLVGAFVPFQIFLMFGLFGAAGGKPFVTHAVYLSFGGNQDQQSKDAAVTRIQTLVEDRAFLEDWLDSPTDNAQFSPHHPQRFRLDVELSDSGLIWVRSYGLRWDPADTLPGLVGRRLAEAIADICPIKVSEWRPRDGRSPMLQTRSYLDNQVHLKKPRGKARKSRPSGNGIKPPPLRTTG
jgi:hypothetical protein